MPAAVRSEADRAWLREFATSVRGLCAGPAEAVRMEVTVAPGRFVDLDSLVEVVVRGLREAGRLREGSRQLHTVLAVRHEGAPGVLLELDPRGAPETPPGPVALDVAVGRAPRPARREDRRTLREVLDREWGGRPPVEGPVWAELELAGAHSLLTPMEPTLDALEPVLGRDPRGQPRQEFFPADDRIVWLRLRRTGPGPPGLRLRLGPAQRAVT